MEDNKILRELEQIKNVVQETRQYALLSAKEILDISEASLLLGVSKQRIYALTSSKEIPHYKQGRLFFKKKELENWMTENRVATRQELRSQAITRTI